MVRATSGPFRERPYFSIEEIEQICTQALRSVGLYPNSAEPIRVERFIEKRFRVSPTYESLERGILGYTKFGRNGVEEIVVSRELEEQADSVSRRRLNTTLAHEAGHGLLHAHLFMLEESDLSLFGDRADVEPSRILCRHETVSGGTERQHSEYDGRWWEYQANQAMGAILLPRQLVQKCVEPMLENVGSFGLKGLPDSVREQAVRTLADRFDVNPAVARIRINGMFAGEANVQQLTL
jgi:hypothetical protein